MSKNHHRKLFRVLAILLPVALLVLVEIALRIGGYGYSTEIFTLDEHGNYYRLSSDASRRYFTVKENATQGNIEYFTREKHSGTTRIFVLGASSSVGFPYMHNGAFPRMLAYRLRMQYPNRNIEVINLSLTAICSTTLRDFASQIVDYEPDAVIIYAGHNEYYGAMGVASTSGSSPWLNRLMLSLSELKIGQWLLDIASKIKGTDRRLTDQRLNLMERMVENQKIPYGSEAYYRGIEQYAENMNAIVEELEQRAIPTIIGTLVYNQGDLAPFESIDSEYNAEAEWKAAQKALSMGDSVKARKHFILAKEYDGLRFRAPEAINDTIRAIASRHAVVRLVDLMELFSQHSSGGIVGDNLLLEHVHPNIDGHALMADAFYDAVIETGIVGESAGALTPIDFDGYIISDFDRHYGRIQNWLLRENWPFNEPIPDEPAGYVRSYEEQVAGALAVKQISWLQAMQMLYEYYIGKSDLISALAIAEGLCLNAPYDESYPIMAAKLAAATGCSEKAAYYLDRAERLAPSAETQQLRRYLTTQQTDSL